MAGLFTFVTQLFGSVNSRIILPFTENSLQTKSITKSTKTTHYKNITITKAIQNEPNMYTRQASSLLIAKLPVELRNIIWTYVLGNRTVHLYYHDTESLRSYVCGHQNILPHAGSQDRRQWSGGTLCYGDLYKVRNKGWIGALTACRVS